MIMNTHLQSSHYVHILTATVLLVVDRMPEWSLPTELLFRIHIPNIMGLSNMSLFCLMITQHNYKAGVTEYLGLWILT
jgi:hypothetical protein